MKFDHHIGGRGRIDIPLAGDDQRDTTGKKSTGRPEHPFPIKIALDARTAGREYRQPCNAQFLIENFTDFKAARTVFLIVPRGKKHFRMHRHPFINHVMTGKMKDAALRKRR